MEKIEIPLGYPRRRSDLQKPEICRIKRKPYQQTKTEGEYMKKNLPSIILMIVLLGLWQIIAMIINAHYILPSPTQILEKLWTLREPLFIVHLPATMGVTGLELIISIIFGLGLAILMDMNEKIENALYPLIIASQTIPTTAIAPLFVLWFGYSIWSKVLVTILITFFPITISVYDGFKSTKKRNGRAFNNLWCK